MTENPPTGYAPLSETPLESWKAIAAYLKRDVSTLKRWERNEGLPVHRHLHQTRASVYAYPSELDAWWAHRRPLEDASTQAAWIRRRPARAVAFTATLLLALATAGDDVVRYSLRSARTGSIRVARRTGT